MLFIDSITSDHKTSITGWGEPWSRPRGRPTSPRRWGWSGQRAGWSRAWRWLVVKLNYWVWPLELQTKVHEDYATFTITEKALTGEPSSGWKRKNTQRSKRTGRSHRTWRNLRKGSFEAPVSSLSQSGVLYCTVLYCLYCSVLYSTALYCTHSPVSRSSMVKANLEPSTPLYQSSAAPAAGSEQLFLGFTKLTKYFLRFRERRCFF